MTVSDAYARYRIPSNLQDHQLRVAALAAIIAGNWTGPAIDQPSLVTACLLHDMANIIKFDFTNSLMDPAEHGRLGYWKTVQHETVERYGNDVHAGTLTICRELGAPDAVCRIVSAIEWNDTEKVLDGGEYETAIGIYSDMRVGPHGILSLADRLSDLRTRNTKHDPAWLIPAQARLEQTIRGSVSRDPGSVTDQDLEARFSSLLTRSVSGAGAVCLRSS
ncbi:HD domain-containing protein [Patescibacteria group bacterium]|nr:HD domain-containing protein [Patescibacteria group bacterium]